MTALWSWLTHKLSAAWVWIGTGLVIAATIIAIFFRALAAGRNQERAKAQGKILKDVEKRNEVDRDVARVSDPTGELRDRWSRD